MTERKGTISVQTGDIFPIIKKWLYSEHDIFLRELIANATDAITKRATLARNRNEEIPTGAITVTISKKDQTITIADNGLGMTEAEIEKYLAQLAFSGAQEFIKNMESMGTASAGEIIGKFGLGFYSSFMVAKKVVVESLSMEKGATPAKWSCAGDVDYLFSNSEKKEIGTSITLHVNEEGEEFLNTWKVKSILKNYCSFMPEKIFVVDGDEEKNNENNEPINDTTPLWKRDPASLKDEDYLDFFRKLHPMETDPLFWLHLKVDHPFNLEGILYFPKLNPNKPFGDSNIKLYCKQVFVSDNVKNIVPEFLVLLKGAIDSPDIPLNVSRSSLQGDPNVKKISNYVVKKVAESLKKLFNTDRAKYETIWEDIALFVKYGAVSDEKFDEQMRERIIFKNSEGKYVTLPEYQTAVPETYKDKLKEKVLYFDKKSSDSAIRKQLLEEGIQSLETDDHIDPHFMQHAEMKKVGDNSYKFTSQEAEISELLSDGTTSPDDLEIKDLFSKYLAPQEEDKKSLFEVSIQKLKTSKAPAYFKVDESMKRFQQMAKSMGQLGGFPAKKTLVLNPTSPLIQNALKLSKKSENEQLVGQICKHVEDLAIVASEGFKEGEKEHFVERSQDLIEKLTSLKL